VDDCSRQNVLTSSREVDECKPLATGRLDEVRTELRALDSTSTEKQLVAKQREADLVAQRNGFAAERDNALDGRD